MSFENFSHFFQNNYSGEVNEERYDEIILKSSQENVDPSIIAEGKTVFNTNQFENQEEDNYSRYGIIVHNNKI